MSKSKKCNAKTCKIFSTPEHEQTRKAKCEKRAKVSGAQVCARIVGTEIYETILRKKRDIYVKSNQSSKNKIKIFTEIIKE